jgi:hypothetical protein
LDDVGSDWPLPITLPGRAPLLVSGAAVWARAMVFPIGPASSANTAADDRIALRITILPDDRTTAPP